MYLFDSPGSQDSMLDLRVAYNRKIADQYTRKVILEGKAPPQTILHFQVRRDKYKVKFINLLLLYAIFFNPAF